jgi:hypothetical protein
METYIAGPNDKISQPTFRLEIDPPGILSVKPVKPHPIGSGYLFEAINEYTTMLAAFDHSLPTGFPIAVGQFTDLSFAGEPVGFVIMGITDQQDARAGDQIHDTLNLAATQSKQSRKQTIEALQYLRQSAHRSAQLLRRLHGAGIIHSHPHLNNFYIRRHQTLGITDFTNAKLVADMSCEEFKFRAFNDFRHLYLGVYGTTSQAGLSIQGVMQLFQVLRLEPPFQSAFGVGDGSGYFTGDDIKEIGIDRLSRVMAVENFVPAIDKFWDPQVLNGLKIADVRNEAYQVIGQLAEKEYKRLVV